MTPEQQEIVNKKEEIGSLEQRLADLESAYADFCVRLSRFESAYLRRISPLYHRLDRWKMRIEAVDMLLSRLRDVREGVCLPPEDPFLWEQECADLIRERWKAFRQVGLAGDFADLPAQEAAEAKSLYRELARRFHPDLAEMDDIRSARTKVMVEINQAYQEQDLAKLKEIQSRPDIRDPDRETLGETLIRLIRRVAQMRRLVREAEERLEERKSSELSLLMLRCERDHERSGDHFSLVSSMLAEQIEMVKHEWLSQKVREAKLWTEVER
jgi:hypothetical protein